MGIKVAVPAPLRQYCDKQKVVELEGERVKDVLTAMSSKYSLLHSKICEENGNVRNYVNLYINGVDIKKKEGIDTLLTENESLTIIPAVAGGLIIKEYRFFKRKREI